MNKATKKKIIRYYKGVQKVKRIDSVRYDGTANYEILEQGELQVGSIQRLIVIQCLIKKRRYI